MAIPTILANPSIVYTEPRWNGTTFSAFGILTNNIPKALIINPLSAQPNFILLSFDILISGNISASAAGLYELRLYETNGTNNSFVLDYNIYIPSTSLNNSFGLYIPAPLGNGYQSVWQTSELFFQFGNGVSSPLTANGISFNAKGYVF